MVVSDVEALYVALTLGASHLRTLGEAADPTSKVHLDEAARLANEAAGVLARMISPGEALVSDRFGPKIIGVDDEKGPTED